MTTVRNVTQKQGLCIGCGICASTCPESAVAMRWSKGQEWMPEIDKRKCTDCGLCIRVCPNTPERISEYAIAAAREGEHFGLPDTAHCFIAYDLNPQNRIRSASGGALTAILMHLLEVGEVEGVIAALPVPAPIGKTHYELQTMRAVEQLDKARSSHYYPLSYSKVLREIKGSPGRYVLIGTPCIMRGIKRLPEDIQSKIKYSFCLACSHNVTGRFLDCLAKQEGVAEGETFIANLRDKFGGITDAGSFNSCFELANRQIRHNRFQTAFADMWRNYFFAQECCLYCPDFYGTDADLSVKDAWGRLSRGPLGTSLLIVRNPQLLPQLERLREEKKLFLQQCAIEEVSKSAVSAAMLKHLKVRDRLVWKPAIRKELLKNNYSLGTLSYLRDEDSFEYWRLRLMMFLSNFFYAHLHRVPVRGIIRISRILTHTVSFIERNLRKLRRVLKEFISPLLYTLLALLKYPLVFPRRHNKTGKAQVLITGGYGYQNTGDEAQLASVISHWERLCPNVKLTILSPNPAYTEKEHGKHSELAPRVTLFEANRNGNYGTSNVWFRWRFHWIKFHMKFLAMLYRKGLPLVGAYPHEAHLLNLIAQADVLHLSGGGYLTGMTLSRLWDNMLLIRIADILSTPVILSGQTIGLFKDKISKKLARWGLNKAKLIYLRDPEESMADIHSLGIKGTHVKSTFDDALFCDMADKKTIDECLRKNGIADGISYVAVNVHYFKQEPAASRQIMRRIAKVCDHIVSKHNAQILFIPLHPDDFYAIEEIQKNMSEGSNRIDYDFDYRITKGIIGRSDILLTMKHHGIIFAMSTGVPTIAIATDDYYLRKNLGTLKLFSQERWLADREKLFSAGFMEKMVDDCFNNIQEQGAIISSRLQEMRKQNGETIQRFLKEYLT